MKNLIGIVSVIAVLGLGGLGISKLLSSRDPVVIEVGQLVIRKSDIANRARIDEILNPKRAQRDAKEELVQAYRQAELLRVLGQEITKQAIDQEERQIARVARPGSNMATLFETFSKEKEVLRRLYLLPMLAERKLRFDYFVNRAPAQMEAQQKGEAFLEAFRKDPKSGPKLAAAQGFAFMNVTISRSSGLLWEPAPPMPEPKKKRRGKELFPQPDPPRALATIQPRNPVQGEFWYNKVAKNLKVGEVHSRLEPWGNFWLALRLVSVNKSQPGVYYLEAARIPQGNFDAWFRAESARVPLKNHL